MQTRSWVSALAIFAFALPGSARASLTQDSFLLRNTRDLIDLCSAPQSDPLYTAATNLCQGFVLGVYQVLNEEDLAEKSRRMFCPDPTPTRNQGIASLVQWAKSNPDQMNLPPADGIASFLSQQYPCRPGPLGGSRARG